MTTIKVVDPTEALARAGGGPSASRWSGTRRRARWASPVGCQRTRSTSTPTWPASASSASRPRSRRCSACTRPTPSGSRTRRSGSSSASRGGIDQAALAGAPQRGPARRLLLPPQRRDGPGPRRPRLRRHPPRGRRVRPSRRRPRAGDDEPPGADRRRGSRPMPTPMAAGTSTSASATRSTPRSPSARTPSCSPPSPCRSSRAPTAVGEWHLSHDPDGSFAGSNWREGAVGMEVFADRHEWLSTDPESGFVKFLVVQRRDAAWRRRPQGLHGPPPRRRSPSTPRSPPRPSSARCSPTASASTCPPSTPTP